MCLKSNAFIDIIRNEHDKIILNYSRTYHHKTIVFFLWQPFIPWMMDVRKVHKKFPTWGSPDNIFYRFFYLSDVFFVKPLFYSLKKYLKFFPILQKWYCVAKNIFAWLWPVIILFRLSDPLPETWVKSRLTPLSIFQNGLLGQ